MTLRNRWFPVLLAHAFLLQTIAILLRLGVVYESVAMGLDSVWVGVIGGAFGVLPALFGLHVGRAIDLRGESRALVWGSLAMSAAALVLVLAPPTLLALLIGSLAVGTGQFLGIVAQQSAASKADSALRARRLGVLTLAIAGAQVAGPLCVSLLSGSSLLPQTAGIFHAGLVLCIAAMVCALVLRLPAHVSAGAGCGIVQTARVLVAIPGYRLATCSSLVIFGAMDLLVLFLPLHGAAHGIAASTVGVLLAVRAMATILSRVFFDRMLGWMGRDRLLLVSLTLAGMGIGGLALTVTPAAMGVLLFVAGLGLGIGAPLTLAWMADIVPPEIRGSAYSLRLAVNRVGQSTIPVLSGLLAAPLGTGGVFVATALALGLNAGVARDRPRSAKPKTN